MPSLCAAWLDYAVIVATAPAQPGPESRGRARQGARVDRGRARAPAPPYGDPSDSLLARAAARRQARAQRRQAAAHTPPHRGLILEAERADLLAEATHVGELDLFVAADEVGQVRQLHRAEI